MIVNLIQALFGIALVYCTVLESTFTAIPGIEVLAAVAIITLALLAGRKSWLTWPTNTNLVSGVILAGSPLLLLQLPSFSVTFWEEILAGTVLSVTAFCTLLFRHEGSPEGDNSDRDRNVPEDERSGLTVLKLFGLFACASLVLATPIWAQDNTEAILTYKVDCARCHGVNGDGKGPGANMLTGGVKPKDFTDCTKMNKVSDDTILKVIKNGGPAAGLSDQMPAWSGILLDPQIKEMTSYIRTFCSRKNMTEAPMNTAAKASSR